MNAWRKRFVAEVLKYINQVGTPDIIHAHTYLGGWVAAKIKEQTGAPYIITEHSTQVLDDCLSPTHRHIATETYRNADSVIAVGQGLASIIQANYNVSVQVIPNFIDIGLFKPVDTAFKPDHKLRLIAIGDLIERKQVDKLIQACAELTVDYHLSIIGEGPEKTKLKKLAQSLHVNHSFLGRLSQQEISQELNQSHILVHTSRTETFGIIIVEAMAKGLPVISFSNGGAEDIITDAVGLLLMDHSTSAITQAIGIMQARYNEYQPSEIRQVVLDRFSPKVIAERLYHLYESLT